jgi:phage replication initiation protein
MTDEQERARAIGSSSSSIATETLAAGDALLLSHYGSSLDVSQEPELGMADESSSLALEPPTAGNTWVERTRGELDEVSEHSGAASGLAAPDGGVMLDYLRASLPVERWAELVAWVGPMVERGMGWLAWYRCSGHVLDGGLLAWDSVTGDGRVLVDLPGRACASMGERLVPFLRWCSEHGHITRLDLALDDRRGLVTYERLVAAVDAGALVSRARRCQWTVGRVTDNGLLAGWTLYIGSRTSEALVRIYDKRAERIERAGAVAEGSWVRVELECKGALAEAMAPAVLEHGLEVVIGELNRRLRFCEPTSDSNRRRWPVAPWWAEFMGSLDKGARLASGVAEPVTVDGLMEYLLRQAAPAIAAVTLARGGDVSWLDELVAEGERRLKPRHMAMLARVGEVA